MKNLFVLIALVACTTLNAQLIDRFSVAVNTGINFSDYTIDANGEAGTFKGLTLELPIGPIAISSGVEVSNYGTHYNFTDVRQGSEDDPAYPVLQVNSFNYKYVGIPVRLKANYKFFYAQVGAKFETFQKQSLVDEGIINDPAYMAKANYDINEINDKNVTAEFALGVNWMPKWTNFSMYLEPTFSYMTKPIFKNTELDVNQYSYGLKLGARYTFKKK